MNLNQTIEDQYRQRFEPGQRLPSLKVNLFKGYEVRALRNCLNDLYREFPSASVDCIMLGDSLLSTHFGFADTTLDSRDEQKLFLRAFLSHLDEIKKALNSLSGPKFSPYLIADMPFGSASQSEIALRNAEAMCMHGADVVKLEAYSEDVMDVIEELSSSGYTVMGHIGYTPQVGGRKSRGVTYDDALKVCEMARRVRDAGAKALVLEGVSTAVQGALSRESKQGIPVYGIFSGRCLPGGISINIWDAVVKPSFRARFFPPTAMLNEDQVPRAYTEEVITEKVKELLRLIFVGAWPIARSSEWSPAESAAFDSEDPWINRKV